MHLYLEKKNSYKISRSHVSIAGGPTIDHRWIRRAFIPKTLAFFRTRVTRDFMEKAREKVEGAYADPGSGLGRFWRGRGNRLAYPEVRVTTSYDQLDRDDPPAKRNIPLKVEIDRGLGVKAKFFPAPSRDGQQKRSKLSFGWSQLNGQLQLYNRREAVNDAVARREAGGIRAFYQEKGYLLARVEGNVLEFGDRKELRFSIDEGPKVRIAEVELSEAKGIPPGVSRQAYKRWRKDGELRKRGTFSEAKAMQDLELLLESYNDAGYLCAQAFIELAFWPDGLDTPGTHATLELANLVGGGPEPSWIAQFNPHGLAGIRGAEKSDLHLRLVVVPGPRILTARREELRYLEVPIPITRRVDGLPTLPEGSWGTRRILHAGPLRLRKDDRPGGVPLSLDLDRESRNTIVDLYRNSGFPVADAEVTWLYRTHIAGEAVNLEIPDVRDLVHPRYGLCNDHANDTAISVVPMISVYEGRKGKFGDTLLRGNFKTRDYVLRRELDLKAGEPYIQDKIEESGASITSLGVANAVDTQPYPVGCDYTDEGECKVHHVLTIEESKDYLAEVGFGFGAATLNPAYAFLEPGLPNLFGTAWDLDLKGLWGLDLEEALEETSICAGSGCYERSANALLSRPQIFASPIDLTLSGRFQRRVTPARGKIDTASASARLSWRLGQDWTLYGGYLVQLANIGKEQVKPLGGGNPDWVNRAAGVVSDLTGLVDTGAVLDRTDNSFNPYKGFRATFDAKLASPYLGGQDWWTRVDLSWQHFIPLPRTADRLNFRYSLRYGQLFPFKGPKAATTTVPEVWRYYGGGTADLGIRGILPETMLVNVEEVELPGGGILKRPRAQGGHIRAIGTVALQVVSLKNFLGGKLAHSLFYDFGVLTQFWRTTDLGQDFRHSIGINAIKWDIDIVTAALGYAILIPTPNNVKATDDRNGRVVFNVGVTF